MATVAEALALAIEHHQAGRLQAAEQIYRQILVVDPNHADALHLLGVIACQAGRNDVAVDLIRRAVAVNPSQPVYYNNLGIAYRNLGRLEESRATFGRAIQLDPKYADAYYNLANALADMGRIEEAIGGYCRALELKPAHVEAHLSLGNALKDQGRLDEAIGCYLRALSFKPDYADAHNNLGNVLLIQGRFSEAAAQYRRALELAPNFANAHSNLGNVLREQGKLTEAVACHLRALQCDPNYAPAHCNLGSALLDQGQAREAGARFRRAMELSPGHATALSNWLLSLQYRPGVTAADLAAAHEEYERVHGVPLRATWRTHANSRDGGRPPRVGFVSADFALHPVGVFLVRLLENLDRGQWQATCYSDRVVKDEMTQRLHAIAANWRETRGLSHEQVAELIRSDGIDILFDLSGHTANNRMPVFARKPAPIQITWAAYVGTTGLRAMDYILADAKQIPPEHERFYVERVLRMPDAYVCYAPPAYAPPVSALPALRAGHVTFGCFNNPAKLNGQVIELWGRILRRLPGSRLVLRYGGMADESIAGAVRQAFASQGVEAGRIECLGRVQHPELLGEYNRVDLALDPMPYSGGLTTCEALWMGVPVITLPGQTFAGRHSLTHLSAVGLTQTIARNDEEYVELAAAMAGDLERLSALRGTLRGRMAASALCDGARFAGNWQKLMRGIWQTWVEKR